MKRVGASAAAVLALGILAACQPAVPDSGAGVGTGSGAASAQARAQRDAALAGGSFEAPAPATATPLDPASRPLPASVTAAVNGEDDAAQANSGAEPVQADPSNPPPAVLGNDGISAEQSFDAVSAERSIALDAQRIAANRAQYRVIAPTDLPTRPGTDTPNIVEYALRTDNPVGTPIYRRTGFFPAQRHASACAAFASPDQAQIEFLSRGGPERDRRGLDPDGDGFACAWDPTPFRAARQTGGAGQRGAAPISDPLAISSE